MEIVRIKYAWNNKKRGVKFRLWLRPTRWPEWLIQVGCKIYLHDDLIYRALDLNRYAVIKTPRLKLLFGEQLYDGSDDILYLPSHYLRNTQTNYSNMFRAATAIRIIRAARLIALYLQLSGIRLVRNKIQSTQVRYILDSLYGKAY